MMKGQARLSAGIMGLGTHMILEPCLLRIPASEPAPGHQPAITPLCRGPARSWPSGSSAGPITTAVWEALCVSIQVI